jgi:hypothetical protein
MEDTAKYFSGVLSAMSCMIGLEVPFVNVMSKMDLVRKEGKRKKEVDRSVSLFQGAPPRHVFSRPWWAHAMPATLWQVPGPGP